MGGVPLNWWRLTTCLLLAQRRGRRDFLVALLDRSWIHPRSMRLVDQSPPRRERKEDGQSVASPICKGRQLLHKRPASDLPNVRR
jgi:hypothetical protein